MWQGDQFTLRLLQAMLFIVLATALSACAGRPKQMDTTRPFNVVEVQVTAQGAGDYGFAGRLQQRLEASVGRATADIGQTSALQVVVIDRQGEPSPLNFFSRAFRSASLGLILTDPDTGQVLRSRALRATTSSFNGSDSESALISRLTDDIRYLLGLSGYTPYPVSGIKQDVAWPQNRPGSDEGLTDAALLVDPLLNGTVTPTTVIVDAEPDASPAIDISKPLLEATTPVKHSQRVDTMSTPALVKVTQGLEYPVQEPDIALSVVEPEGQLDEPCIITLDNDCSDPDSR